MEEGAPPGELVDVPSKYKGLVMGTGGDNLRKISTQTGAKVTRKDGEVYIVSGTEDQRQQAKMNINMMIVSKKKKLYRFIFQHPNQGAFTCHVNIFIKYSMRFWSKIVQRMVKCVRF